ncbi:MAG: hypothetical protein NXH74_00925 [Rhodobacteraceae bacterium]|nr:hypothetical protein [Paracoccaceae bacterium]
MPEGAVLRRIAIPCLASFLLAGCFGPAADIGRLSDQDLPKDTPRREVQTDPSEGVGGLLSQIFARNGSTGAQTPDAHAAANPATDEAHGAAPDTPRRGLFGWLGGADTQPAAPEARTAAARALQETGGSDGTSGGGLSGLGGAPAPKVQSEIAFGTVLPYGRVAVICDVPARKMGKKIAGFPERRETFALYDSEPGNTAPHSFYLTGFDDGCARQFTASLAVFGSVTMHERLRYGLPAEVQPYSDTDKAYETLKSKVCGVPRRAPCGERISRLERDTVFLSIYERFGDNARWKNLLLHDGDLLAKDVKGG